jgi:lambda repressor-like predicted transcriptional regulator
VFGPGELRPYIEQILDILAGLLYKMLPGFARLVVSEGTVKRLLRQALDRVWPKGEPVALGTNELTNSVDRNRLDI